MNKIFRVGMMALILCGLIIWSGSGAIYAAREGEADNLAPNSPFYFIDRLEEKVNIFFMPPEKRVNFYFELSMERFEEAIIMYKNDDSDKAFELFKEGLGHISDGLKTWKLCIEKDIETSGLKDRFNQVIKSAKDTFNEMEKEFNWQKVGEITKDIAEIIKEQMDLLLKGD